MGTGTIKRRGIVNLNVAESPVVSESFKCAPFGGIDRRLSQRETEINTAVVLEPGSSYRTAKILDELAIVPLS